MNESERMALSLRRHRLLGRAVEEVHVVPIELEVDLVIGSEFRNGSNAEHEHYLSNPGMHEGDVTGWFNGVDRGRDGISCTFRCQPYRIVANAHHDFRGRTRCHTHRQHISQGNAPAVRGKNGTLLG